MHNSKIALAALVMLAGCGGADDAASASPSETTAPTPAETTTADATDTASVDQVEAVPEEASKRTTVSGTVDSLVLETDPPIVMLTAADGTKYIGNVAASAADAVTDAIKGVGSKATLDCKPAKSPEGAEPGYTWLEDCKLAG